MNKVILSGNLGTDPEVKDSMTTFRLATNETWVKDGEKVERTEWHNIIVFGKQAELCAKYLTKGRTVIVDGKIRYRKVDLEGKTLFYTDIIANHVDFIGKADPKTDSKPFKEDDFPF